MIYLLLNTKGTVMNRPLLRCFSIVTDQGLEP